MKLESLIKEASAEKRRTLWKTQKSRRVAGTIRGTKKVSRTLPASGEIKRYIVTSAQNNTRLHKGVWENLVALAKHYSAEIIIGTFSYDQNQFREMAVKRGTEKPKEYFMWYDRLVEPFISDERIELAPGLVWCGEMNILPTAPNPLAALESYTSRKSAIFPHAKMAMRSIPAMQGEDAKLNYTTGTVTKRNYVQKRLGLIAEHHHVYGALLVEVNHQGHWWVRQLNADSKGRIQDLGVLASRGKITEGQRVEAITWGDIHGTMAEGWVVEQSAKMLDELKPKYQFLHDLLEGASINRHVLKRGAQNEPHYAFYRWLRGLHRVDEELKKSVEVAKSYIRPWCKTVAPDANHDGWWLHSWLEKFDYRVDPANAELFLELQKWYYSEIRTGKMPRDVNIMKRAMTKFGLKGVKFLLPDQSFKICNGQIECGMHGHLGLKGRPGTPESLSKMGRKANIAHTHSAGIYDGLYVAGTSSKLRWTYTFGPMNWTHSHIVTYPTGKRAIITMYAGSWRA